MSRGNRLTNKGHKSRRRQRPGGLVDMCVGAQTPRLHKCYNLT
jgi:hypothetical protein